MISIAVGVVGVIILIITVLYPSTMAALDMTVGGFDTDTTTWTGRYSYHVRWQFALFAGADSLQKFEEQER